MKAREQPSYLQSETLKLIQEEEKNGRQQRSQPIKSKHLFLPGFIAISVQILQVQMQ